MVLQRGLNVGVMAGVVLLAGCDAPKDGDDAADGTQIEADDSNDAGDEPAEDGAEHGEEHGEGDPPADTEPEGETEPEGATEPDGETEPSGETEGETDSAGEPPPEACEEFGASRACSTATNAAGTQYCGADYVGASELYWSDCVVEAECVPGDLLDCGIDVGDTDGGDLSDTCVVHDGVPMWQCSFDEKFCACNTPLVLSFDGAEPQMTAGAAAAFDLDVAGGCLATDWPASRTPWLAIDRDGDGAIADGRELFGSGTRLRSGARARHGFAALAELDDDGNGIVDARDAGFAKLVLWSDEDADRRGTALELAPLGGRVLSLRLDWHAARQCDDRGNCGIERAAFTWIDRDGALRHGEIVDVHLACQ